MSTNQAILLSALLIAGSVFAACGVLLPPVLPWAAPFSGCSTATPTQRRRSHRHFDGAKLAIADPEQ